MTETEATVALNMVSGVGSVTFSRLYEYFGSVEAVLNASEDALTRVQDIGPKLAHAIRHWEDETSLATELAAVEKAGVRLLLWKDEEYPRTLKKIENPPFILYVKGKLLPQDENSIAIVGSRLCTLYGQSVTKNLATGLAYAGVTVVSGGARGIDTAAHKSALDVGGRTIVVCGNGLNVTYPAENLDLFKRVAENGAVISQFPMGLRGSVGTYPIRNRIVAGMTQGTVVVEAGVTSGAMITARMATELNKQVFAVPGRVDSPRSGGCHKLIKEGARLCETVEDIFSEFRGWGKCSVAEQPELSLGSQGGSALAVQLSADEQRVFDTLNNGEQHLDAIVQLSGLQINVVQTAVMSLTFKQCVEMLPGKIYRKKR